MKWFEGSIGEAVAATRSKKAIFVVFIEGKDDESVQVAQAIDESEVSSRLDRENFVAIKLESGSDSYRFFAEMYQLVPVPSIFFIDNGIPMEIVAGKTTASELAVKIDGLLKKVKSNSSLDLISAEQKVASASSSGSGASSSKIVDKVPERVTPTLNKDHKTEEPMTVEMAMDNASLPSNTEQKMETEEQTSGIQDNQIHLTAEEKLERARKLIELQKKQRQEEEDRKQRERELERRKVGRDVQKMRQKQQDLEMKLALEERAKEKAAEAAARDRVRQQIAQDKLERKEREMKLQQTQQQQQQQQQSTSQQEAPKAVVSNASVTRIQFRLPSGDPHMGQFEPTSTLGALRNYVAENVNLPFRHFSMSTSFPRRELNTEEDDKTLLELELVPTAVILILPMRSPNATSVTSTQDVGFLSKLMWTIFAPIIGVFNLVMGYFSGGRQTTRSETPQNDASTNSVPRTDNNVASTTSAASSHFSNAPYASGLIRRNVNSQGGSTIRTQGNIHRLHSGGEDNDENNTWNGNSTQQM